MTSPIKLPARFQRDGRTYVAVEYQQPNGRDDTPPRFRGTFGVYELGGKLRIRRMAEVDVVRAVKATHLVGKIGKHTIRQDLIG